MFENAKRYSNAYNYERARRLKYSSKGIFNALKRFKISKKKKLDHPSDCSIKRGEFSIRRLCLE
ncbi:MULTISPECIES: IS630 transposase-related protein [Psychrobacter]|uniref:IS630 transposase-related protein n=1 Tax=Psychrobacter TaxID=497 RepID=UPI001CB73F3E|nr:MULTISPECIES: IS630 transposase-related protein [Psychrobacter]